MFSYHVCRYPDLDEPPYDQHGYASFDIYPCCGTEFGYDDANTSHDELREKWIKIGFKWLVKASMSKFGWDPIKQLSDAGLSFDLLPKK